MDEILRTGSDPNCGEDVVFKVKLRSLTIGHLFLLYEIESPLLNPFEPIGREDILRAVLICSQPYRKARASLTSNATLGFVFLLALLNRKADLEKEREKFQRYLAENRRLPATRLKPGGRGRNSPEAWRLLTMLLRDFRMSLDQAMDCSIRRANCLWAVSAEMDGALELMPSDPFNSERLRRMQEIARERRQN
jgi:hypothetical protein